MYGTCSCRRPDPPHVAGGTAVAPPLPPLPLTSKKESQAYQRELHTVTVGEHMHTSCTSPSAQLPGVAFQYASVSVSSCTFDALGVLRAAICANLVIFAAKLTTYFASGSR